MEDAREFVIESSSWTQIDGASLLLFCFPSIFIFHPFLSFLQFSSIFSKTARLPQDSHIE